VQPMEYFGQPRVETEGVTEGSDFAFTFVLEVEPDVTVNEYKGLEVVYPEASVADATVDSQVSARLQSRASLAAVDEARPVTHGDAVMVELNITDAEGEVVDQAPGTMIKIGEESWYKGLDAELIGQSPDEAFSLEFTFPEDAGNGAVAGVAAKVEGKVLSIQELRAPELSDELAEELGYEGGAAGMRTAIQAQLQERADNGARNQARANLLQVLVDANDFGVPAAMTEQFFQALMQEVQLQQWQAGRDVRQARFSDAEVADLRTRARFAAKASLILKAVARDESIGVDDAELDAKIQEIADQRDQRVEAIKAYLQKEEAVEQLRERILEEKTLDWLLEQSELKAPEPAVDAAAAAAPVVEAAPAEEAPAAEAPAPKKKAAKKKAAPKKKAAAKAAPAEEAAPAADDGKSEAQVAYEAAQAAADEAVAAADAAKAAAAADPDNADLADAAKAAKKAASSAKGKATRARKKAEG